MRPFFFSLLPFSWSWMKRYSLKIVTTPCFAETLRRSRIGTAPEFFSPPHSLCWYERNHPSVLSLRRAAFNSTQQPVSPLVRLNFSIFGPHRILSLSRPHHLHLIHAPPPNQTLTSLHPPTPKIVADPFSSPRKIVQTSPLYFSSLELGCASLRPRSFSWISPLRS